ncbi:tetratricopeptide repeat-containing sensor histidine kinase [Arundinibacter roseus]|uniref:histidine kinase n=1 Tax=Arundinibacter roseus TaxID=2070510 RepID=A0A4R4KAM2_9BACT|nr:ATP-binding protein [Arundinibacter roseus]TDB63636.1 hypothetical protein EZE20_15140 [Arundinibacter roseus]
MMRTLPAFIFFLLCYSYHTLGQSSDSLLQILAVQNGSQKAATLLELGKAYFIEGQDSLSKLYAIQSYQLAVKLDLTRIEGDARLAWVRTEMAYSTSLEEAYAQLDTVDRLAARTNDQDLQAWAYFRRAQIYSGSLKYEKQVDPLMKKALTIFEKTKNAQGIGSVYVDMGGRAAQSGNYINGIDYYLKAQKLLEPLNNPVQLRAVYGNLASSYQAIGEDAMTINYGNKTLKLAETLHDPRLKAFALAILGDLYMEKKQYKHALAMYSQQEKVLNAFQDQSPARAKAKVAHALAKLGKYDQALAYCKTADSLYFHRSGYEEAIDYFIEGLYAEIYLAKKLYKKTIFHAERGINSLQEYGELGNFHLELASFHSYLADAYEQLRQPEKALIHFRQFKNHSDSLINNDALEKIANATMMSEFEKKEEKNALRIATLENDKLRERQAALFFVLLGGIGILGLIGWSNKQLKSKNTELSRKNKEIQEALHKGQSIERKRVASELHDNLNTKVTALRWNIESIDKQTLTTQNTKIFNRIFDLSGDIYTDIRLISHSMLPAELEKNGLEAALCRLMNMLENNQTNRTNFHLITRLSGLRFPESLEYQLYIIALELINNIIKHAQASDAWISISKENNQLWLIISDNGVGFHSDNQESGMGSVNLKARVEDLNGTLSILSEDGKGTQIRVNVPFQELA